MGGGGGGGGDVIGSVLATFGEVVTFRSLGLYIRS